MIYQIFVALSRVVRMIIFENNQILIVSGQHVETRTYKLSVSLGIYIAFFVSVSTTC